jgi:hypothetical protein
MYYEYRHRRRHGSADRGHWEAEKVAAERSGSVLGLEEDV